MTRYLNGEQYFLLEVSQSAFDSLSTAQKRDLKKYILEVGLRGRVDGDAEDDDEVNAGVTHLPNRMTQARLPVVGPKRFAIVEVVLGDPADPARLLTLAEAKAKFVAKLANRFGLSENVVNNAITFTVFDAAVDARAYLTANAAMWGEEVA